MSTLKISDLSVGDWVRWTVYDKTYIIRVTQITDTLIRGIHDDIEYGILLNQISPIPITAEILENNGFEFEKASRWYICELEDKTRINVWIGRNNEGRIEVSKPDIFEHGYHFKYADIEVLNIAVHQLQHALRLAGVDKELTYKLSVMSTYNNYGYAIHDAIDKLAAAVRLAIGAFVDFDWFAPRQQV